MHIIVIEWVIHGEIKAVEVTGTDRSAVIESAQAVYDAMDAATQGGVITDRPEF